jgi:hypothetical protein
MKTLILSLIISGFLFAQGAPKTYTGIITDTMCGADHASMGATSNEKCVRDCVRSGNGQWKYALLGADKKMYVLSDQQTPEKFAAKRVKVTGTVYEKTGILKVDKIEASQ